jgi:hypothetical protein
MRVTVQSRRDGGVDIGTPEVFAAFNFYNSGTTAGRWAPPYDVTLDGKRLLVIARTSGIEPASNTHINVVVNWFEELKRLVPIKD